MSKYDSVDRLMNLATEKATPVRGASTQAVGAVEPDAHRVLEAQVSRTEPGVPVAMTQGMPVAMTLDEEPSRPSVSRAERGRQLLGALRPFLPVVGSALRMVDHGAVQAVARLLPLLGGPAMSAAPTGPPAAEANAQLAQILSALDTRQTEAAGEAQTQKRRIDTLEEQLRRTRESLERMAAEQNTENHELQRLADRTRLLSAGVIILLMLVIAEMALFVVVLHK